MYLVDIYGYVYGSEASDGVFVTAYLQFSLYGGVFVNFAFHRLFKLNITLTRTSSGALVTPG